jgi:hypothetical protein
VKRPDNPVFRVLRAPNLLTCHRATKVVRAGESPQSRKALEITVCRRRARYGRRRKRLGLDTITLTGHLGGFQRVGSAADSSIYYLYRLYFECTCDGWKILGLPTKKFTIVVTHFEGNQPLKGYIDENDAHSLPA